jgi:hypothetical protein
MQALRDAAMPLGGLDGVTTFCEMAVPLVARLAEALGLPGNTPDAVDAARDKVRRVARICSIIWRCSTIAFGLWAAVLCCGFSMGLTGALGLPGNTPDAVDAAGPLPNQFSLHDGHVPYIEDAARPMLDWVQNTLYAVDATRDKVRRG